MNSKLAGWDDTIVALATPPGLGAIGVIRLSGTNSLPIIDALFPSKKISLQPSHTLHVGLLKNNDTILDEVVVSVFKKPASYTAEDVVEISCHGSAFVHDQVMQAIISKGARLAKPGEFTQRAFLNGKLDLVQAEAVADLIASNTAASQKAAFSNMRGKFSETLKALREQLIRFSSLIELELDFSEEDVEFADRSKLLALVHDIKRVTTQLLASFSLGNVIKNGVNVAIAGKPNAGKSTLLNTLLNDDRALVSEIPGTTRDTIEETLNINGILFRIIDTAGIREHSADVIENMGITKSLEKIGQADIVLYIFDAGTVTSEELGSVKNNLEGQQKKFFLVINKSDMISQKNTAEIISGIPGCLVISAKENEGIEHLKRSLFLSVTDDTFLTDNPVVTNVRHYQALLAVQESLNEIKNGLSSNLFIDLLSLEIRKCLHHLGEITGEISNEDRLDYIFSKFCIGK